MAKVRKYRGRWVADFRDQHGKRRIETPRGHFENAAREKLAAQALLAKRLEEVGRGDHIASRDRLTFSEVADQYMGSKCNLRPSTVRSYTSLIDLYLRPYFGAQRACHITAANIEQFRNELAKGLPPQIVAAAVARELAAHPKWSRARAKLTASRMRVGRRTINKALTVLVMIFNYAARHRIVDFNPAEHIERLPDTRLPEERAIDTNILTPDQVRRLIEACAPGQPRMIVQLAVFTGMRQGEILGLQWGDIDWVNKQVLVRRAWREGAFQPPKTKYSVRRIDLPDFLVHELKIWKLACPNGEYDLVVPNRAGNPQSHSNLLQRDYWPALRRAGLPKIRFHDLRHTFASLMIANGEDIVRVSRLLGHASPNITLGVYSHALPREHYGSSNRLADLVYGNSPNDAQLLRQVSD